MENKDMDTRRDKTSQSALSPFSEFERMAERFFGDRFPAFFGEWSSFGDWPSRKSTASVRETDKGYVLCADVPGVPKDDIDVHVHGNILTIHAEHKSESGKEASGPGYRREYRTYHQSFTLPTNVEAAQVEAHCENGRLEVFLPKNSGSQKRKIEIQSGKSAHGDRLSGKEQTTRDMKSTPTAATSEKH